MANIISRRPDGRRGNLATRGRDLFGPMQDVFDTFFGPLMSQWAGPMHPDFSPRLWDINMEENDKEVVVRADLPGFEPDDIDVRVEPNLLTIQAEHRKEGEREQDFRSFFRSVSLPASVNAEQAQANYRNGVLELHIPRREEDQPRRIRVQATAQGQQQPTVQHGQTGAGNPQLSTPQAGKQGK